MNDWEKRFHDIINDAHDANQAKQAESQQSVNQEKQAESQQSVNQESTSGYSYSGSSFTGNSTFYSAEGGGASQPGNQGEYNEHGKTEKKEKKGKKFVTRSSFIIALVCAIVVSGFVGAMSYALMMSTFGGATVDKSVHTIHYNLTKATGSELSIQEIAARNLNSVVAITTESLTTSNLWFGSYVTQGAGSGVIYSQDGYIITNNHVIENASSIKVTMHDGSEYTASLVAADEVTDVAVIKIDAVDLPAVTFADYDTVSIGDLSVVIGNPLGTLSGTTTAGIISALEREITIEGKAMILIQTDAAINPGNSGGGMFDQYGNLIGIVVAKSSGSAVEGIGFAIPCDKVQAVTESLIANGYVEGRPQAGIKILDLTSASDAMKYGVSMTGVYIYEVTGENAKEAGLQSGDLIYMIDNVKVTSGTMLIQYIQNKKIGDTVTFTIVRNNQMINIDTVLEAQTPDQAKSGSPIQMQPDLNFPQQNPFFY